MPRTLPWATSAPKSTTSSPRTPTAYHHRNRSDTPSDLVNSDLEPISTPRPPPTSNPTSFTTPNIDPTREPSSSPPPPESLTPPPIEFMQPGPLADDRWIMVEDEFTDTAKLFTSHIHRAEYDRLKRLARSRPAEVLANLSRGTDGITAASPNLKRKFEQSANEAKRRNAGIDGAEARDGVEDKDGKEEDVEAEKDEYLANPMLAGLMMSTRKEARDLSSLASKTRTRAAAGFSQSPHKGNRTRDVFAEERERMEKAGLGPKKVSVKAEDDTEEETEVDDEDEDDDDDDDDLDAQPRGLVKVKEEDELDEDGLDAVSKHTKGTSKFTDRLTKARDEGTNLRPLPKGLGNGLFSSAKLPKQLPKSSSRSSMLADLSPNKRGKDSRPSAPSISTKRSAVREERARKDPRPSPLADEVPTFII